MPNPKPIIDEIDRMYVKHGVYPAALWREVYACLPAGREEELDFIINYDIKYRMGKELSEGFLSEEGEG